MSLQGLKITDLTALTPKSDSDYVVVHDVSAGATKKMLISTLLSGVVAEGVGGGNVQFGIETGLTQGTPLTITFDTAFTDTDYVFLPFGQDVTTGETVLCTIGTVGAGSKTANGITVTPSDDCTLFWIAAGTLSTA